MNSMTNCEKLAEVFNRASEQGKSAFCKMLWGNQPESVQTQLKPLLSETALAALRQPD